MWITFIARNSPVVPGPDAFPQDRNTRLTRLTQSCRPAAYLKSDNLLLGAVVVPSGWVVSFSTLTCSG